MSVAASPEAPSNGSFTEEHRAKALSLFMRYDLDGSGTINSDEEASQLLLAMSYSLKDGVKGELTPELLDSKTKEIIATNLEENPLDFEAFWAWFVGAFGEDEGGPGM